MLVAPISQLTSVTFEQKQQQQKQKQQNNNNKNKTQNKNNRSRTNAWSILTIEYNNNI
jgi:hypothetical protein